MSIRVLQVGKFYPPHAGGIETTTKDIFEVNGDGYVCDVLCFSSSGKTIIETHPTGKIIRCGTLFNLFSMPFSFSYFYYFIKIHKQYDVIHLHHPNPQPFVCLLFLRLKAKLLIHWHSDILNKGLFYKLFAPIEKQVLKKADCIAGTTPVYIDSSPMLQPFLSKTTFVPSAFDEASLQYDDSSIKAIQKKYNDRKIIFALGRHVNYKGFNFLITAAKSLGDDVVVLIGGVGPLYDYHKKLITELHVEDKVFLVGRIPNEELGNYYKACSIFCLPSCHKSEAFGLVMIEAMYFGKPIVATKIPGSGVSWVNDDGVTGLNAENENPASLAGKITILLKNAALREEYGSNAHKRFMENFTSKILRQRFFKLYNKITGATQD